MKTPSRNILFTALAVLVLTPVATMNMHHGDRGTILSIHSQEASGKFKTRLGLPYGQAEGGRYAVVNIDDGAYGDASFALVYVPPQFEITENNVVELDAAGVGVLAHPGSAAVTRVINDPGWRRFFGP